MYPKIPSAQTVILTCLELGITNVVISPGSRNIPLAVSFASNKKFSCFSIVDERSAGFFALGISQQTNKPTIVLCTSGSALLNYSPAVSESFYSEIPLIIISADRPAYKINIGDGQTINQNNVFGSNVLCSKSLLQDVVHETDKILLSNKQNLIKNSGLKIKSIEKIQSDTQNFNEEIIFSFFSKSIQFKKPVHINIPLEEPLYEFTKRPSINLSKKIIKYKNEEPDINEFKILIKKSLKILVLVGSLAPETLLKKTVSKLSKYEKVVVLTESTSNLHDKSFFGNIDQIIAPIEISKNRDLIFSSLKPEIIITIGGMIISKKIKDFLRNCSPIKHFHVGFSDAKDTFFKGVEHIKLDPNFFFKEVMINDIRSGYNNIWRELSNNRKSLHKHYIRNIPFSDLLVFSILSSKISSEYHIQVANSSPIRYLQLFEMNNYTMYSNRGTSGIDGSTSTAVGYSVFSKTPTLLITGDLSFLYDTNGLWNNYINSNFRIIIINNGGGGIFRILPGFKDNSVFSKFIETQHNLSAKYLAKMYGFIYQKKSSKIGLKLALKSFFKKSNKPKILEVKTSSKLSSKILKSYFKYLSES